jgi:hypothetical protein
MKRAAILVSVSALLVATFAIGASSLAASRQKKRAEAFLKQVAALQIGVTSKTQVGELFRQFRNGDVSEACAKGGCSYSAAFDNAALSRLHLADHTRFGCSVGVVGDTLRLKKCYLESGDRRFSATVHEMLTSPMPNQEPFYISRRWSEARWQVYVWLTPKANSEQHRAAYGFNLKCFTRYSGCEDAAVLLPAIQWNTQDPLRMDVGKCPNRQ